jgi:hypothetical protein
MARSEAHEACTSLAARSNKPSHTFATARTPHAHPGKYSGSSYQDNPHTLGSSIAPLKGQCSAAPRCMAAGGAPRTALRAPRVAAQLCSLARLPVLLPGAALARIAAVPDAGDVTAAAAASKHGAVRLGLAAGRASLGRPSLLLLPLILLWGVGGERGQIWGGVGAPAAARLKGRHAQLVHPNQHGLTNMVTLKPCSS